MALTKCKECGHDLSKKAEKCPHCGAPQKTQQKIGCGSLVVLVIFGWIVFSIAYDDSSTTTDRASPARTSTSNSPRPSVPQRAPLELLSFRCEKEHGYVFVRGEVRNRSASKLDNVTAVGEFRNAGGQLVKLETALVEYNPLMPGQTTPFQAGGTDNPEIKSCGVGFKHLLGGPIGYERPSPRDEQTIELVTEIQSLLNKLGYPVGAADGVVGSKTRSAIEAFQRANGLTVDGAATNRLLTELRKATE